MYEKEQTVKGQGTVQLDFRPSFCFHKSNQPGPLTNGLTNIFKFNKEFEIIFEVF